MNAAEIWTRWRVGPALLALFAGWFSLIAWSGMVAAPRGYLVATLLIGAAIAISGVVARGLRLSPYVVVGIQVLVGVLGLNVQAAREQAFLGLIPTWDSIDRTWFVLTNGAATLNTYTSPVQVNPLSTGTLLTACGLGVILAVDVLALTLRRAPLAALPLLAALSVPVSILREGLALPLFVIIALLFLRLVASDHLLTLADWGRRGGRRPGVSMEVFWQGSAAAIVAALLLTPLIPVSDLLQRAGNGDGPGVGNGVQMTTVNPFIRLRRDLVEKTHTPLIYATTEASSTSYLRTTVLDEFDDDEWRPQERDLPSENDADGALPGAPGLAPGVSGETDEWELYLDSNFATAWLPTPYPVLDIDIGDGWRFDSSTLDVAYVAGGAPTPMSYKLTAFEPELSIESLRASLLAPPSVREPMTELPDDFPDVIREQAEEVTKDSTTRIDQAIALQEWFRSGGNFTYSLEQRGGSGMDMLANFVTDDRIGYCEQFASAMAAMGRSLGIPSRVVVGFLDGQPLPDGRILYTSDERHAWPEMYFPRAGWIRFEPTPAQRAGSVPAYTRGEINAPAPSASASESPTQAPAQRPEQSLEDAESDSSSPLAVPWPVLVGVVVVVVLAVGPTVLRRMQRRRRLRQDDPTHLAEGAWAELGATAVDHGLEWPDRRSPREQAQRVSAQVSASPEDTASLEGLLTDVERSRYAPPRAVDTLDPETRDRTVETVESWRHAITGSVQRRWRARLLPRSLFRRRRD